MNVTIVLDSVNPFTGIRLTTMELVYPQLIHQQFLTHRMFSRNSSSFRAMSTERVLDDELVFPFWTKEKRGMQGESLNILDNDEDFTLCLEADEVLKETYSYVQQQVKRLKDLGIHHQNANAYLRPFQSIHTLVTATDWNNFFALRLTKQAQPEIFNLALLMKEALRESEPIKRYEHLPFVENNDSSTDLFLTSAARCARISYLSNGGDAEKDLALGKKLWDNKHLSPFEHQAFARGDGRFANFNTWQSYRNMKGY